MLPTDARGGESLAQRERLKQRSYHSPRRWPCPVKFSAVGGKPSEVSLYVLSAEPLLNKFIFDRRCAQVNRRYIKWNDNQPEREGARLTSLQNMRSLTLAPTGRGFSVSM